MPFVEFSEDDLSWTHEKRADVLDRIASVREYAEHLKRWDREFLDSIEMQLRGRGSLTEGQMVVLELDPIPWTV